MYLLNISGNISIRMLLNFQKITFKKLEEVRYQKKAVLTLSQNKHKGQPKKPVKEVRKDKQDQAIGGITALGVNHLVLGPKWLLSVRTEVYALDKF